MFYILTEKDAVSELLKYSIVYWQLGYNKPNFSEKYPKALDKILAKFTVLCAIIFYSLVLFLKCASGLVCNQQCRLYILQTLF